nr:reverse transcriptase domain-containing protein [Tanacetum cinerariifolium]
MNDVSLKAMQNQIDMVKNKLRNEMKTSIQTSLSNQTNEIKNMMAILLQMNTTSTSGSGTLPGNTVANPKGELKAITTRSGLVTEGPTVPNPPKSVNLEEDECVEETYTDPDHAKYTIKVPPPPPVQKPKPLIQRNFVLHTRDSLPPHIPDPRVPLILERPFLRTAHALIDVHASYSNHPRRESVNLINIFNLSSEDCLEDLVSNKQSGNPTFLLHKEIASLEVIHEFHDSKGCTFLSEELPDINSFNDVHSYFDDDPLSGSTTFLANSLLEEFADELALITCEDSDFKDSIDQSVLTHCDDLFVDPTPEMFTDEQPPDFSFLPRFDVYPDDFLEIESDATFDNDSFDSKGKKIKEAELLIDQFDLPCDILSEYDSFNS